MLFRAELKKLLFVRRGAAILLVCLIAKILFLAVFPEMKDPRIRLSQNQYDKMLAELSGESSAEKNAWVEAEYARCLSTIDAKADMERSYAEGGITEDEYRAFTEDLERAYLRRNAAQIFAEKARQFAAQDETLPPAHYLYEYGWQTVFTLLCFPDLFLLAGLLFLSAASFSSEVSAGMLPVLLAAKNGRTRLFAAKLAALSAVGFCAALLFGAAEGMVFSLRGWLRGGDAPLHSVTVLTDCRLGISLLSGYALCMAVRVLAALLFAAAVFGVSVWVKSPLRTVFLGAAALLLPLLAGESGARFTHCGLLCGTGTLLDMGDSPCGAALSALAVAAYTALTVALAGRRFRRGL